jgi:hypothetical protein
METQRKSPVNKYLQQARAIKAQKEVELVRERSAAVAKVLGYAAAGAIILYLIGKILRLSATAVTDAKVFLNSFKK